VNGKAFFVRMNLWFALHWLRSIFLWNASWWIDAICINQTGLPERNMVVAQMGKIYSKAQSIIVWLGEADGGTPSAFHFISEMSKSWIDRSNGLKDLSFKTQHYAE
jgi:hypothetical protein